jgi:hypothetical protein
MLLLPLVAGISRAQQPQAREGDPQVEAPQTQDPKAAPTAEAPSWTEQFRKRHPDLAGVMDLAEMAPPELRAKALITIANSPELKTEEWKRNILLEAFASASLAHEPLPHFIPQVWIMNDTNDGRRDVDLDAIGSRTFMQRDLFRVGIDRLSLQTAAINGLLTFDVPAAKDLYLRMPPLVVERLGCEDALVPSPGAYYTMLEKIIQSGFSPEERRAGRHVALLADQIRAMTSQVQLARMSKLLRSVSLTPDELGFLIAQYTDVLAHMGADDRSFSASLADLVKEVPGLVSFAASQGIPSSPLAAAYRDYLRKGFKGERCPVIAGQHALELYLVPSEIRDPDGDQPSPVGDQEPGKTSGKLNFDPLSDSAATKDFMRSVLELAGLLETTETARDSSAGNRDPDEGKKQREAQFDRLVQYLDDMQALPGEDDEHYLLRKGHAFSWTIATLPPGPQSKKLIGRYVDFLNSAANSPSLLAWLPPLGALLEDPHFARTESKKRMLNMLTGSGAPALGLYARLQLMSENQASPHEPGKDSKPAPER